MRREIATVATAARHRTADRLPPTPTAYRPPPTAHRRRPAPSAHRLSRPFSAKMSGTRAGAPCGPSNDAVLDRPGRRVHQRGRRAIGAPLRRTAGACAVTGARHRAGRVRAATSSRFSRRNCYECHGTKKARGQLRLDRKSSVFTGGMSGPAIAPGDSENSVLVRRLLGLDGEDRMPLDKDPLPDAQIALIRRWIDQGAAWPDTAGETAAALPAQPAQHWAYVRPVRHAPPAVRNESWARTPIDRFVLATLEAEGLAPSPEASREALLRRVSLDLIGLPPTPQEIDAFLADTRTGRLRARRRSPPRLAALRRALGASVARPRALRRLERLREGRAAHDVEVPRLGDRGAQSRHAVRPVHGRADRRRHAAERDAGTARSPPGSIATRCSIRKAASTSRRRAGRRSSIASTRRRPSGSDPRSRCAQCHNHKYDPFSQRDYYRMLAFFDNGEYTVVGKQGGDHWIAEPELDLPTPEQAAKRTTLQAELDRLKAQLEAPGAEIDAAQGEWEQSMRAADAGWTPLEPAGAAVHARRRCCRASPTRRSWRAGPHPRPSRIACAPTTAPVAHHRHPPGGAPRPDAAPGRPGPRLLRQLRPDRLHRHRSTRRRAAGRRCGHRCRGRADDSFGSSDLRDLLDEAGSATRATCPRAGRSMRRATQTRLRRQAVFVPAAAVDVPGRRRADA